MPKHLVDDWKRAELAFQILEEAEIMEEFADEVWIQVDKYWYEEFIGENHV